MKNFSICAYAAALRRSRAMSLLLALPAMRYACGGVMFARNPLTTQLVSAVGGRRTMVGAQRFSPLLGAPPTHGVLQVRAASSKKKDKAGGKKEEYRRA